MSDELMHYGTPRHSGRYPWGSGKNPYQRNANFIAYVKKLEKEGLSRKEIAKGMNMSLKQLRARLSVAKDDNRNADTAMAYRLKEKGYSNVAIGKRLGVGESTVRSLLDPAKQKRAEATRATAKALEDAISDGKYLDVGAGAEHFLGCSRTKLETALDYLEQRGYTVETIPVMQQGTGKYTTVKVLAPEGVTKNDIYKNKDLIKPPYIWSDDGGYTYQKPKKPVAVDSKRVQIRYAEQGGKEKDGVIELRRGVEDISLGDKRYAQVRINVDDTHYLKGMAVYSDDMPKGVDIVFNTNKHEGTPKKDVLKPLEIDKETGKVDWENPFGATIREERQRKYIDKDGKEKLSAINIVNWEGDWGSWRKNLSSQVLSKQAPALAKKQLAVSYDIKKAQYDEIMSLTNDVIKEKLLKSFADECDSSSVHLEAAALPRQATQVILPLTTLRNNEVYAPNFNDGDNVVLIRYPHAGTFEIPELKVNNRNKEGNKLISKNAKDAIGINSKVAEQLSGADFDGDFVLVIPNNRKGPMSIVGRSSVKSSSPLLKLQDFDPKEAYPLPKGKKPMEKEDKGREMGKVSNLITDMTLGGAEDHEIAAAVRHSMVVIDAVKHKLDYKQSYIDNDIAKLQKRYQGKAGGGAATLISRAKSPAHPETRRERIDKETGAKIYLPKPSDTYISKKTGKVVHRTTKSTKMAETSDAMTLSSGTPMEKIYGDHANKLKALANEARRQMVNLPTPKMSRSAKETYAKEVETLKSKVRIAEMNAPKERQAQSLASVEIKAKRQANPDMDSDELKKLRSQALTRARDRVGANKKDVMVEVTDREWEAIQAGAVSATTLRKILNNTDEDKLKQRAMPKDKPKMDSSRIARAKSMLNAGCTQAEVAELLGVSVSTLSRALNQ